MNERIKKLKAEALVPILKDGYTSWVFNEEKFAELIVRECVAAVLDLEMSSSEFVAAVIESRLGYEQQSLWNENDE